MQFNEKNTNSHTEMKFVISCSYYNSTDELTHKANLLVKLDEQTPVKQTLVTTAAQALTYNYLFRFRNLTKNASRQNPSGNFSISNTVRVSRQYTKFETALIKIANAISQTNVSRDFSQKAHFRFIILTFFAKLEIVN